MKPTFDRPAPIKSWFYHPGWCLDFFWSAAVYRGRGVSPPSPLPVDPPLGLVLSPVESRFVYTQRHNVKSV